MNKITFTPADGSETVEFFVLEQTRVAGIDYLLVTDQEDGDGEAWILKDTSAETDPVAAYEFVEDPEELNALSGIFSEMMDDIDLE